MRKFLHTAAVLALGFCIPMHGQMRIIPRSFVDSTAQAMHTAMDGLEKKMQFDSTVIHLGTVNEDAGPVQATFRYRNISGSPIRILRLTTSCTCVRAVQDRDVLNPGAEGRITVTYDQKGHPGRHDRMISVFTDLNGGKTPTVTLTLCTDVTVSGDAAADYPVPFGHYRLTAKELRFQTGKAETQSIGFISLSGNGVGLGCEERLLPGGIGIRIEKDPDGAKSEIIVSYDGSGSIKVSDRPVPVILRGTGLAPTQSSLKLYFR